MTAHLWLIAGLSLALLAAGLLLLALPRLHRTDKE